MCSLENAIETMDKSVLVSHEVFKILIDEYRKAHTEDAVTALLDNQDIGVATEGEIITLLKSARLETEQLKEHVLALQGSANAFQVSKCESCKESHRADKELAELNKLVDKYNNLAHMYNELEARKSSIPVHHFPEETPVIPEGEPCVGLYLLSEDKPLQNVNDHSTLYNFEVEGAFRPGNKPCYFIYTKDVLDALNKAALNHFKRICYCPSCGTPIPPPESCNTYEDVVKREG